MSIRPALLAILLTSCVSAQDDNVGETEQAVSAPCTITVNPPASGVYGQNLHFTATASCTGGTPEIEWLEKKSNVNTVIGAYSTATSFDYIADQAGQIMFGAYVRRQGITSGEAPVFAPMVTVTVADDVPSCTSVKLTSPVMGQNVAVGSPLALSATATCGTLAPEFQFWVKPHGTSTWTVLDPTGPYIQNGQSGSYTPTAAQAGTQLDFSAVARAVGAHVKYSGRSMSNTVSVGSSTGVPGCTISLAVPATAVYGVPMHLVATAQCNTGPAEVNFLHHEGTSYVSISGGFQASQTLDFASTIVGMNYFKAQVRTQGTTTPTKETAVMDVQVADDATSLCSNVKLTSPTNGSTFAVGALVTLAGTSTCTNGGSPEFEFWVKPSASSTWIILPGYTTTSSQWNTTGLAPGTWNVLAAARSIGAHASYQTRSMASTITLQ